MADDQILSFREVAVLLKSAEKIASTLAQTGKLPSLRVRGQWRTRPDDIDRWLARHIMRGDTEKPASGSPVFIAKEAMGYER